MTRIFLIAVTCFAIALPAWARHVVWPWDSATDYHIDHSAPCTECVESFWYRDNPNGAFSNWHPEDGPCKTRIDLDGCGVLVVNSDMYDPPSPPIPFEYPDPMGLEAANLPSATWLEYAGYYSRCVQPSRYITNHFNCGGY